jgi:hypothetical protein
LKGLENLHHADDYNPAPGKLYLLKPVFFAIQNKAEQEEDSEERLRTSPRVWAARDWWVDPKTALKSGAVMSRTWKEALDLGDEEQSPVGGR